MATVQEKREAFAQLHAERSAWVIPNPWDAGSAKLLQGMGFKALATTSAGFAYTLGRADGQVSLEEKLAHCRLLCDATDIPINADFENGFADDPEGVAVNVARLAETGVAGCSIEDFSRDDQLIYGMELAIERVQAAAEAIASLQAPMLLTARAENLLRGVDNLDDTLQRLQAFQRAGADVLYAPGVNSLIDLRSLTSELDRPFNVLASFFRGVSIEDFSNAGATRVSLGGAVNYATISPLISAGEEMQNAGTFGWLETMANPSQVRKLLGS